jgi:hypothetical protein
MQGPTATGTLRAMGFSPRLPKASGVHGLTVRVSRGRCSRPGALLALGDVERDVLALGQLAEALARDIGVVGENVRAAAFLLDEAEALFAVNHFTVPLAILLSSGITPGAPLITAHDCHIRPSLQSALLGCRSRFAQLP